MLSWIPCALGTSSVPERRSTPILTVAIWSGLWRLAPPGYGPYTRRFGPEIWGIHPINAFSAKLRLFGTPALIPYYVGAHRRASPGFIVVPLFRIVAALRCMVHPHATLVVPLFQQVAAHCCAVQALFPIVGALSARCGTTYRACGPTFSNCRTTFAHRAPTFPISGSTFLACGPASLQRGPTLRRCGGTFPRSASDPLGCWAVRAIGPPACCTGPGGQPIGPGPDPPKAAGQEARGSATRRGTLPDLAPRP